ncbi:MAG: hypothetical protein N4A61_04795 [Pelagimonas sp.]|jgi:hypothetical protein|nr:hypothetical protein [Pelagimonas sp.]
MDAWVWISQHFYGALVWLTGEAGRLYLAGAVGGAYRALMSERRRWRDGIISVVAGVFSAPYLAPVVLAVLEKAGLQVVDSPNVGVSAGFLAGLTGMSLAKLVVAMIEGQAAKLVGPAK